MSESNAFEDKIPTEIKQDTHSKCIAPYVLLLHEIKQSKFLHLVDFMELNINQHLEMPRSFTTVNVQF